MTSAQVINKARWSGMDFQSIEDDLRADLQVQFAADFNDFAVSGMGILLMDMVASVGDILAFYLDRRVSDTYLVTARTRGSVSKTTRQIGYKMGPAVASSVDLRVALKTAQSVAVPLPVGFQFKGPDGLIFEAAEAVTFDIGNGPANPKTVPAYEGETVVETFTSSGAGSQEFKLARVPGQKFIVQGSVSVLVDGVEWIESDFITFDATNQYEIDFNGTPSTIAFGDGAAGNIPSTGASIQVTYVASRGKTGQAANNTIADVVNKLVVGFQTIDLVVTNPLGATGGDDPETLASAKVNGPRIRRANGAAVTQGDYLSLASAYSDPLFGRVAAAHAFCPRSAASDAVVSGALVEIGLAVAEPLPVTATQSAVVTAELAALATQVAAVNTANTTIAASMTATDATLDAAQGTGRDAKNRADEIVADTVGISEKVGLGKAAVDEIAAGTVDSLTAATADALKDFFDRINTVGGTVASTASTLKTSLETQIASLATAREALAAVGLTTADVGSKCRAIQDAATATTSAALAISTAVGVISTVVVDVNASVAEQAAAINDHFDQILSADCKTNVVVVSIVTRDASGFYASPSLGLISSLQSYLAARSEVSQVVQVVSGGRSIVKAALTLHLGVLQGFQPTKVEAAVAAAIDGLLKGRDYGRNLYVSDVERTVVGEPGIPGIPGVRFVDVSIDGYLVDSVVTTDKLNAAGNLLIQTLEVISKGSVTITSEVILAKAALSS